MIKPGFKVPHSIYCEEKKKACTLHFMVLILHMDEISLFAI